MKSPAMRVVRDIRHEYALIVQLVIVSVEDDHLVCHSWDGETAGNTDILVAKPYLLRRTPFDGGERDGVSYDYTSSIQRTATKDATTETQVIVPTYVADDVIYAARFTDGGTDVVDDDYQRVSMIDMNVDGRAWAKQ